MSMCGACKQVSRAAIYGSVLSVLSQDTGPVFLLNTGSIVPSAVLNLPLLFMLQTAGTGVMAVPYRRSPV